VTKTTSIFISSIIGLAFFFIFLDTPGNSFNSAMAYGFASVILLILVVILQLFLMVWYALKKESRQNLLFSFAVVFSIILSVIYFRNIYWLYEAQKISSTVNNLLSSDLSVNAYHPVFNPTLIFVIPLLLQFVLAVVRLRIKPVYPPQHQ
jgi:hypothetical protein